MPRVAGGAREGGYGVYLLCHWTEPGFSQRETLIDFKGDDAAD